MDTLPKTIVSHLNRLFDASRSLYGVRGLWLYSALKKGLNTPLFSGRGNPPLSIRLHRDAAVLPDQVREISAISDPALRKALSEYPVDILATVSYDKDRVLTAVMKLDERKTTVSDPKGWELMTEALYGLFRIVELNDELQHFSGRMEQMVNEMGALHEMSRAFESSRNLDLLLKEILLKCQTLIHAESSSLMLLDREANELEFKVVLGPKSEEVRPMRLPMGKGIGGWVARYGKPLLIPDAYADPRFNPEFDRKSGYRTRSILAVPLIYKSRVIGVVSVLNRLDGMAFCESDKIFLTTFASQAALAVENAQLLQSTIEKERMERELKVAGEIQQMLIPQELPEIPGLEVSATYIPCREVSGDFYDVIRLDEHRYVFVVADVAGKGVPAALMVSTMQASLIAYLQYSRDLPYIVQKLNDQLIRTTAEDRFITFFIGLFDARDGSLCYVNAGHNPPVLIGDNGSAQYLETGGIFIGTMPWEYESETVRLHPGSVLCLFTDGLTEVTNDRLEQYGMKRLLQSLMDKRQSPPQAIIDTVIAGIERHIGLKKMDDDLTMVVVRKL